MKKRTAQEVATRRRALRLWLNHKRPCDIIRQLSRSHKWFYKWLNRFKQQSWLGLEDQSRRPHTSSPGHPRSARQLVVRLRRQAEKRKVGLIGARALHSEIRHSLDLRFCHPCRGTRHPRPKTYQPNLR